MPKPPTSPSRTPIVLSHGLFGFGEFALGKFKVSYFNRIDRALTARGFPLIVTRVHPTGSIGLRAHQLKTSILKHLRSLSRSTERRTVRATTDKRSRKKRDDEAAVDASCDGKVIIIAHSMGGLDARYMISRLGMADRVAALVTLSTPHHGSPYADWCLKNLGMKLGAMKVARMLGLDVQAIADLSTESCARFNDLVEDAPQVRYFSVSACKPWKRMAPFFIPSWRVIDAAEGDNDGMVSLTSAQWGEHLATWEADHLQVINKHFAVEFGKNKTGDMAPKYLDIVDHLVREKLCDGATA
jgi:triacylglycerol lipase